MGDNAKTVEVYIDGRYQGKHTLHPGDAVTNTFRGRETARVAYEDIPSGQDQIFFENHVRSSDDW